jgi:hypothetical protein
VIRETPTNVAGFPADEAARILFAAAKIMREVGAPVEWLQEEER